MKKTRGRKSRETVSLKCCLRNIYTIETINFVVNTIFVRVIFIIIKVDLYVALIIQYTYNALNLGSLIMCLVVVCCVA
jgi:hypothetical protein